MVSCSTCAHVSLIVLARSVLGQVQVLKIIHDRSLGKIPTMVWTGERNDLHVLAEEFVKMPLLRSAEIYSTYILSSLKMPLLKQERRNTHKYQISWEARKYTNKQEIMSDMNITAGLTIGETHTNKLIFWQIRRVTTIQRPPLEISLRGEFISAGSIFV